MSRLQPLQAALRSFLLLNPPQLLKEFVQPHSSPVSYSSASIRGARRKLSSPSLLGILRVNLRGMSFPRFMIAVSLNLSAFNISFILSRSKRFLQGYLSFPRGGTLSGHPELSSADAMNLSSSTGRLSYQRRYLYQLLSPSGAGMGPQIHFHIQFQEDLESRIQCLSALS